MNYCYCHCFLLRLTAWKAEELLQGMQLQEEKLYRTIQKEPKDERCLLTLDFKPFKS